MGARALALACAWLTFADFKARDAMLWHDDLNYQREFRRDSKN